MVKQQREQHAQSGRLLVGAAAVAAVDVEVEVDEDGDQPVPRRRYAQELDGVGPTEQMRAGAVASIAGRHVADHLAKGIARAVFAVPRQRCAWPLIERKFGNSEGPEL